MSPVHPTDSAGSDVLDAVIGLGSNLGDRLATLRLAVRAIAEIAAPSALSPLYETDPVGPPGPPYLNAAVRLAWSGSPQALLAALLSIEARFGRVRRERFGPRTLDLDVLWIDGVVLEGPDLVVPHPRLLERRFALLPLVDVAPDANHASLGLPLASCLGRLAAGGVRRVADADWASGAAAVF